jgi:hypothetical protein
MRQYRGQVLPQETKFCIFYLLSITASFWPALYRGHFFFFFYGISLCYFLAYPLRFFNLVKFYCFAAQEAYFFCLYSPHVFMGPLNFSGFCKFTGVWFTTYAVILTYVSLPR